MLQITAQASYLSIHKNNNLINVFKHSYKLRVLVYI